GVIRERSRPANSIAPAEPIIRDSALSSVVLPAPLLPTSATTSALLTSSETSRSTGIPPYPAPSLETFRRGAGVPDVLALASLPPRPAFGFLPIIPASCRDRLRSPSGRRAPRRARRRRSSRHDGAPAGDRTGS